jgi:hypothetical protein
MPIQTEMKHLLLTFDIEEFDQLDIDKGMDVRKQCKVSAIGLSEVLKLLKRHKIKATFFTTYIFVENQPKLIEKIIKEGHELGLHAYKHSDDYTTMDEDAAFEKLNRAKRLIEKKFKIELRGFRGPQMRRPSYKVLKKMGIVYDSSLHPTWMPGYYNNLLKRRGVCEIDNVKEIPLSVAPLFRLSIAWIFFRNFPLIYSKIITKMCLIDSDYINLYFHPWEFVDIDKNEFKSLMFLIRRKTGNENLNKLEKYILWCKSKGMDNMTMGEYASKL